MTDVERFKTIVKGMTELYQKKNANYGNSFEKLFNELGPISGLVPLHNKLDRLTNLVKGGHNDFESLEDTLVDLANYAIMNVIELQKIDEKTTPVKTEEKKKWVINEDLTMTSEEIETKPVSNNTEKNEERIKISSTENVEIKKDGEYLW